MNINALEKKLTETMTEHLELKGVQIYTGKKIKSLDSKIQTIIELISETASSEEEAREMLERVAEDTLGNVLESKILVELGLTPKTEEEIEKTKSALRMGMKGI